MRNAATAGFVGLSMVAGVAHGNGRPAASVSVHVRPGDPSSTYLATTFGLMISHDDGCSFRWVCEQNIGYAGTFDPKYAVARDGTIYATTFDGLRVSHDGGCSFETATAALPKGDPARFAGMWVDGVGLGPDDDVWIATAETAAPNGVFRSTDAGVTFTPMGLLSDTIWWKSVLIAPSRGQRVYVTGYELAHPDDGVPEPLAHVLRSDDGGATWTELPLVDVVLGSTPVATVAAIDPTDPDRLWLRAQAANPPDGDRLYRSVDGGDTWIEVLSVAAAIRDVVVRADGTVLVATPTDGLYQSTDAGATFTTIANPPRLSGLAEDQRGNLLGCGTNWEPDFLALGTSTTGERWEKVFRFVDMAGPLACPAGTTQHDVCDVELWPGMTRQYAPIAPVCDAVPDGAPAVDARGAGDDAPTSGCCDGGDHARSSLLVGLLAIVALRGRRGVRARRAGRRATSDT